MAPLAMQELAETIAVASKQNQQKNSSAVNAQNKAVMVSTASLFLSLSGGFALQVALMKRLPARLRRSAVPIGFACAVAMSVHKYMKEGPTTTDSVTRSYQRLVDNLNHHRW
ncbi:uncharacterized protein LOC141908848 [Tubulanus polymorphus]|uniref:uncharacterized protein LOC141908848 n=1 Tax=Tubulanus polymorphus TaxID=672921 RepID=UPI003DA2FB62